MGVLSISSFECFRRRRRRRGLETIASMHRLPGMAVLGNIKEHLGTWGMGHRASGFGVIRTGRAIPYLHIIIITTALTGYIKWAEKYKSLFAGSSSRLLIFQGIERLYVLNPYQGFFSFYHLHYRTLIVLTLLWLEYTYKGEGTKENKEIWSRYG